jgi:hypothetical protein
MKGTLVLLETVPVKETPQDLPLPAVLVWVRLGLVF